MFIEELILDGFKSYVIIQIVAFHVFQVFGSNRFRSI